MKKYGLYRFIGNIINYRTDNFFDTLEITLKYEATFTDTDKIWVINRVYSKEHLNKIEILLNKYKQKFLLLDFNEEEYLKCKQDFNLPNNTELYYKLLNIKGYQKKIISPLRFYHKNKYLANNNGCRNFILEEGKKKYLWTFVIDGFCFFTEDCWNIIVHNIKENDRYIIIPLIRLTDNTYIHKKYEELNKLEKIEPQIAFHKDSEIYFNQLLMYGRQPKSELLTYLNIKGVWNNWKIFEVENELYYNFRISDNNFNTNTLGFTLRLNSSKSEGIFSDKDSKRSIFRHYGIINLINNLDKKLNWINKDYDTFLIYNFFSLKKNKNKKIVNLIVNLANKQLNQKIKSVIDKNYTPKSNNKQDYFSISPYYHFKDGKYIKKDCKITNEIKKNNYDNNSFKIFVKQTILLTIAYVLTKNKQYSEKAKNNIIMWFVDKNTSMTPHLKYAQSIPFKGKGQGIIECRGLIYLTDCIKLLKNFFSKQELTTIYNWFDNYLSWLINSKDGKNEFNRNNNHSISYITQIIVISHFLSKINITIDYIKIIEKKLKDHIDNNGVLINEITRNDFIHYILFTVELLISIINISSKINPNINFINNNLFVKALDFTIKKVEDENKDNYKGMYNKDVFNYRLHYIKLWKSLNYESEYEYELNNDFLNYSLDENFGMPFCWFFSL